MNRISPMLRTRGLLPISLAAILTSFLTLTTAVAVAEDPVPSASTKTQSQGKQGANNSGRSNGGNGSGKQGPSACKKTAQSLFLACRHTVLASRWSSAAQCINTPSKEAQWYCAMDAKRLGSAAARVCAEQKNGRINGCEMLGQDAFTGWEQAEFDASGPIDGNDYFPLIVGSISDYRAEQTITRREVTDTVRQVDGVSCRLVIEQERDTETSALVERRELLFAEDVNGSIWNCGVLKQQMAALSDLEDPVVVSTDGSWQAGEDGAQAGLAMPQPASLGLVARRGYQPDIEEGILEVLDPAALELAEDSCAGECVILRIYSAISPLPFVDEYYEQGTGLVHIQDENGESVLELDR